MMINNLVPASTEFTAPPKQKENQPVNPYKDTSVFILGIRGNT